MAVNNVSTPGSRSKRRFFTLSRRRNGLRAFAAVVMVIYTIFTLFPFYTLFVRSFVPTKESGELHLWIPEAKEVSMDAQVGNLGVFYDLDLKEQMFGMKD